MIIRFDGKTVVVERSWNGREIALLTGGYGMSRVLHPI